MRRGGGWRAVPVAGDRLLFGAGHRWPAEGPLVTARFAGRAVDDDDDYDDDDDDDDDEVGGGPHRWQRFFTRLPKSRRQRKQNTVPEMSQKAGSHKRQQRQPKQIEKKSEETKEKLPFFLPCILSSWKAKRNEKRRRNNETKAAGHNKKASPVGGHFALLSLRACVGPCAAPSVRVRVMLTLLSARPIHATQQQPVSSLLKPHLNPVKPSKSPYNPPKPSTTQYHPGKPGLPK